MFTQDRELHEWVKLWTEMHTHIAAKSIYKYVISCMLECTGALLLNSHIALLWWVKTYDRCNTAQLGLFETNLHLDCVWTFRVYAVIGTFETLTVHSGFHLPFLKSPEFHDFHHLKYVPATRSHAGKLLNLGFRCFSFVDNWPIIGWKVQL